MSRQFLKISISFVLGVLWTLFGLSVAFIFLHFNDIFLSVALAVFDAVFWIIVIILVEMANIQIEKLEELKKQSEILENIEKRLYE